MNRWLLYRKLLMCSVAINLFLIFLLTKEQWPTSLPNEQLHSLVDDVVSVDFNCHKLVNSKSVQSIFFLKTHKTAGSSIQNIILRKVLLEDLSVGLTRQEADWVRLCPNTPFSRQCLCNAKELPVNVLAHHMLFNKSEVKASLKSDARYVSILRDPVSLLYSAYTYFRWRERFNYSSFEDFVIKTKSTKQIDPLIVPFRNLMMFDFGLHPKNYEDDAIVDSKIAEIESTFDLIMIRDGEYFKQSLILLKNLMHWTVVDVAVVAINKMMSSALKPVFSKSLTHHLLEANQADYKLYRKFLTIFKEKVKKFGAEKMKKELEELNYTTNKLANFCIAGTKRGSRNTTVYILSKAGEDNCYCRLLVASEKDLTRQLRQRYNKKRKKEVCRIRGYL